MHISVLLNESIENLNLKEDSIIIDCTLGRAGHSSEILKRIKKGFLFAFDQDEDAILYSKKRLEEIGNNFEIIQDNFCNIKKHINTNVDGILFDLGVSSPQLDEEERGFSFHKDARLDMRMDKNNKLSAYEVVNTYPYEKLVDIFYRYGEEKYSTSIAKKIIQKRNEKNIETTLELVEVIKSAVPEKYKRETHPARRVFQAIRIEVNNELEVLEIALKDALKLLKPGGRICVITFQSLEDRIVSKIFKEVTKIDDIVKNMPVIPLEYQPDYKLINKITPSKQELENNSRARSAKLRIIERIK